MAIVKGPSPRRREVRKTVAKPSRNVFDRLDRSRLLWATLFIAIFTIFGGLLAINGRQPNYQIGQELNEPKVARVEFQIRDNAQTQRRRDEERRLHPDIFTANEALLKKLNGLFTQVIHEADRTLKASQIGESDIKIMPLDVAQSLNSYIDDHGKPTDEWNAMGRQMIQKIFTLSILESDVIELQTRKNNVSTSIIIIHPDPEKGQEKESVRYLGKMYDLSNHLPLIEGQISQFALPFPQKARDPIIRRILDQMEPTYFFNEELTEIRREEAAMKVADIPKRFEANSVIVKAQKPLEQEDLIKLKAETEAYRAYVREHHPYLTTMQATGQFGLVFLLACGLWCYIFAYSDRLARNPMRGVAITGLFLLCQGLAVGGVHLAPGTLYLTATFPTLMAAMILAIAYDQRFALAVGAMHTVLVMYSLDLPVGFAVVLLSGIGISIGQLHEVRSRSKLVHVGLWTAGAMVIATMITTLADSTFNWANLTFAAFSGIGVGMFVQAILPMIERAFKVTTSMTLKELNDASHPLLQRLAQAAPGTYQHSLRLADITEASADSIGANGLLCRVGAMYHDIGKMNKPAYFIENQGGGPNRHSKLSPAMSVLIIVGHVKDGVEMAREYGLPPILRHFIESHHGTTLVEYFYHAAKLQREAEDQPAPTEFEFRYPGPKPQTKEAAIMMLGDSVESACRALDEPTPARIEQLVHTIAQKRLMDGQFDECNLTLQELHRIEVAMTKTLCAVYHSRIKYPGDKKKESTSGESDAPMATPTQSVSA